MEAEGRRQRGSLGRSNTLVSRKVRKHEARWGRQAKQALFVLVSPPLEMSQKIPVCRFLSDCWSLKL